MASVVNAPRATDGAPGVALVTGAARRIGRAIATDLGSGGWAVAVHHRSSRKDAEATAARIEAQGGRAAVLDADLADEDQAAGLVERAGAALGPVTCLVNNASVFTHDSVETATRQSWDLHLATNLRGPFVLMQHFAAALPVGQAGNIINLLDQRVWNLTAEFVSYTVAKAGLWTLTQTMALALAPRIRVNGIGPGPVLPSRDQAEAQFAAQLAATPLGAATEVEAIAAAVRFILASPTLTGQMIALDSGQHLGGRPAPAGAADG